MIILRIDILNLFGKKEKSTINDKNMDELVESLNNISNIFAVSGKTIGIALKAVGETVEKQHEIQRLQKIQSQTKKQRTKNKLQKRIETYGK